MSSGPLLVSHLLLWVVVLLLTIALLALVRQVGLMNRRLAPWGARVTALGPQIGQPAPAFTAADMRGRSVSVGGGGSKRALIVFLSTHCKTCGEVAPAVRSIARSERAWIETVVVNDGPPSEVEEFTRRFRLDHVPTVVSEEIKQAYQVSATPYAYLVGGDGRTLAKGIVNNFDHLESIVRAGELGVDSRETFAERQRGETDQVEVG